MALVSLMPHDFYTWNMYSVSDNKFKRVLTRGMDVDNPYNLWWIETSLLPTKHTLP
jgi:hypothetical protein